MHSPNYKDLTGNKIGIATAIKYCGKDKYNYAIWEMQCECGQAFQAKSRELNAGDTKSCGCLKKKKTTQRNLRHGASFRGKRTKEYAVWCGMKNRCYNKNSKDFPDYGGRGITVCDRWLYSFECFLSDMGNRPSSRHSIGRQNNNWPYQPNNCLWELPIDQARNTRKTRWIFFNGETKCLIEWALSLGIKRTTLGNRLSRGWSIEKAFSKG